MPEALFKIVKSGYQGREAPPREKTNNVTAPMYSRRIIVCYR